MPTGPPPATVTRRTDEGAAPSAAPSTWTGACTRTVGESDVSNRKTSSPIDTWSPGRSVRTVTRSPLTYVPLPLPRSFRTQPFLPDRSSACTRDAAGSVRTTALLLPRPSVSGRPVIGKLRPARSPWTPTRLMVIARS